MSVSAMATRGLGMSARAQSRSMAPWSSGACSGVTMWPCMPHRAILSENQYWQNSRPAEDHDDEDPGCGGRRRGRRRRPRRGRPGSSPVTNIRAVTAAVARDVAGDGHQAPVPWSPPAAPGSEAAAWRLGRRRLDVGTALSPAGPDSSPAGPAVASSALSAASSLLDLGGGRHLVQLGLDVVDRLVEVGEGARGQQLVDGPGPGLHARRSCPGPAAWWLPASPIDVEMPETASPTLVWASAAV